jgi:hypothetical protein
LAAKKDFIDIRALFKERLGLDHGTFCELIFGCASKFVSPKLEELEANPEAAVLRTTYFSKAKIPADTVSQFFSKITCTESAFVEKVKRSNDRPDNDLTLFQAFPLIEIAKDSYACLDPGFLADKAGRDLYWSLFSQSEKDQKSRLPGFWGTVFELYVNHILNESYAAGGKFIAEPKFADGGAAFDACILEGRNLFVMEHKSSVLRADAKYSGNPSLLKKELDLKFIDGDADGAKGVSQLSKHLGRFLAGENLGGIDPKEVDRVYPVMVCLESTMVTPYLGRYLNERFRVIFSEPISIKL